MKVLRLVPLVLLLASAAVAAPEGWLKTLEDGQDAAKKSGKPILAVTVWPQGV